MDISNFLKNLTAKQPQALPVVLDPQSGEMDYQASFDEAFKQPRTLGQHLFGRNISYDNSTIDPETNNTTISTVSKFQPGFFNNLTEGYRENYLNNFNPTNWGEKKNWSTRIGEGLGTLGKFIDSPVGRGALALGLSAATGYGEPLQEFATATVGRQQNRMADQFYRDQLEKESIDTSNIKGNLNSEIYKNYLYGKQLKDNAEWREANLQMHKETQEAMKQYRESQLKAQQDQRAIDNAFRREQLNQGKERINLSKEKAVNKEKQDQATQKQFKENMATISDIDRGLELIKENPNAYAYWKGKIGADIANRIDPKGVKTRTQIDNITAVYRKWLTGAQMSDAERKAYERFLPAPTDNAHIVQQKLEGMRDSIQRKNDVLMYGITQNQQADNDPLGILGDL